MSQEIKKHRAGNFTFRCPNERVYHQVCLLLSANGWSSGSSLEYWQNRLNFVPINKTPMRQILIHTDSKSFGATSASEEEKCYERIETFEELCSFLYYFRIIEVGKGGVVYAN